MNKEEAIERSTKMEQYQVSYNILKAGLKAKDNLYGLLAALYQAKIYMLSDDILLYRLGEDQNFHHYCHTPFLKENIYQLNKKMDSIKEKLIEQKYCLDISLNDDKIKKITFVPINLENKKYRIIILNNRLKNEQLSNAFLEMLQDSFSIILERMEMVSNLKKMSEEDALTSLGNRLSYNQKIEKQEDKKCNYILLDLFRLKYINDNLGHEKGDYYIKETANILKKYFPKYKKIINEYGITKEILTGDSIYRIGGDEFVILSEDTPIEILQEKLKMVSEEVQRIDLEVTESVPIGINYGIAEYRQGMSMEDLSKEADIALSEDKKRMYEEQRINRRK